MKRLTEAMVRERLEIIAKTAGTGDFERAHLLEDSLHREVLKAIAEFRTSSSPARFAQLALDSHLIEFRRVYA